MKSHFKKLSIYSEVEKALKAIAAGCAWRVQLPVEGKNGFILVDNPAASEFSTDEPTYLCIEYVNET